MYSFYLKVIYSLQYNLRRVFVSAHFPADTVSYRQPDRGSLLIQYINEIFKADAHREHIQELFRKVSFTQIV